MYHEDRDELIELVAAELRQPVKLDDAFDERVMSYVRSHPRTSALGGLLDWITRPRELRLSPLAGLATAALLLALVAAGTWELARQYQRPTVVDVAPAEEPAQLVQFILVAPDASRVSLVGDFNGWDLRATPMEWQGAPGLWTVSLPLAVGRHQYAFVVDDTEWVADPTAPPSVDDDFGTPSSVVTVAMGGA